MKRWRESLRWIAITQGRGGPVSVPSILLGQLLLEVIGTKANTLIFLHFVPNRVCEKCARNL